MRVLVVAKPRFPIPPEQLPAMVQGALHWRERHRDSMDAFGTFVGGGGFAIFDVADEETLHRIMIEMPFTPFSELDVRPFLEGDRGLRQWQQLAEGVSMARA